MIKKFACWKMENFLSDSDLRNIVQELSQGRELARQLHIHLLQSSSRETGEVLLNEILNSFEQALCLINHGPSGSGEAAARGVGGVAAMLVADPPQSLTGSPPTEASDHESKDQANRKRRWTRKVEVCGESGIEGQQDDGYGWRKYGQKDILGAKYPRGYYRCTHRYGQGCLATKQIQRSDDDPNIFDITYSGIHTCDPAGNSSINDPPIPSINQPNQLGTFSLHNHQYQNQPPPFFNIQTSHKVISHDLHTSSFPSSSNIEPQNFASNNHGRLIYNLYGSGSEAGRVVATSTISTADSATLDVGFPHDISYDFGSNFNFEDPKK